MSNPFGLDYNRYKHKISEIKINSENNNCKTFTTKDEFNQLKFNIIHNLAEESQITEINFKEQSSLSSSQKRKNILKFFGITNNETYKKTKEQL